MAFGLGGLASPLLTGLAQARGSYVQGQQEGQDRQLKQALAALAQKRQAEQDALAAKVAGANIGHLNAETESLSNKSDYAGHVFSQDGTPYIVHKDGTLSKATVRGQAPTVDAGDDTVGDQGAAPPPNSKRSVGSPVISNGAPGNAVGDIDLRDDAPTPVPSRVVAGEPGQAPQPTLASKLPKVGDQTPKFGPLPKPLPPDPVKVHQAERDYDNAHPAPVQATNVYLGSVDPTTGQTVYSVAKNKGDPSITATDVVKPGAAGAAKAGGKEKSYVDLMTSSIPVMDRLSSKVRPAAISAAIAAPTMANAGLTTDEQLYLQAARSFLAGVLHQESGARLSKEQWQIGLERYFPTLGDADETKAAKLAAAHQVAADRAAQVSTPVGGGRAGGSPQTSHVTPAERAALKAQGFTDAQINAYRP